jgi:hypothetical protein
MPKREDMTITEQLAYSTVRIECVGADAAIYTGTGFFIVLNAMEIILFHLLLQTSM